MANKYTIKKFDGDDKQSYAIFKAKLVGMIINKMMNKIYKVIKTGCNTEELFSSEKDAQTRYEELIAENAMIKINGMWWPSYYREEIEEIKNRS